MSSIRFAGEGENVGTGSRSRKKRRTSILKAQSPSRMALGDLDPNAAEQKKLDAKSKRRSSKRVSFADTMHVQEFWTDHHAKQLGLWDTSHDSVAGGQPDQQQNQEDVDVQSSNRPRFEDQSNVNIDQVTEQVPDDLSEKSEPKISGLETLLTGPIRNTPTESEELTAKEPQPCAQTLSTSLANVPLTSSEPSPITQEHHINVQQIEQFEIQFTETCSESTVKAADKSVSKKHSRRSLTLVGAPSYLQRMPSNDSIMSVSMDHMQHSNLNLSQGGADMDLTDNQSFFKQFLQSKGPAALPPQGDEAHVENDVFIDENSPADEMTDNKSFFQQFMSNTSRNTFGLTQTEVIPRCDSPAEKLDNQSFFSALMGSSSSQQKTNISSTATLNRTVMYGEDEATGGMEFTTCIGGIQPNQTTAQMSNQVSSKRKPLGERIEAHTNSNMTIRFEDHGTEGDMEMTGCYNSKQQSSVLSTTCKQPLSMKADATQIFNQSGAMEMTTCIGGIHDNTRFTNVSGLTFMNKTYTDVDLNNTTAVMRDIDSALGLKRKSDVPAESMHKVRRSEHSEGPAHESTRVFSGGFVHTAMKDDSNEPPALSPIKKEASNLNQCGDETAAIELTGCISNIHQGMPSTSTLPRDGIRHNTTKQGDRTRVFTGEDSGDMEMTECHSVVVTSDTTSTAVKVALQTSKVTTDHERTKVFQPDETCGMELTTCVAGLIDKNASSRNESIHKPPVVQRKVPNDMDKTKIFQPDDTCGMELTACVGNLLPNSQNRSKRQENTNSTRKFSEEADNMDMTECMDSFVKAQNVSSDALAKAPNLEVTKRFSDDTGKMELTACIGNVHLTQKSTSLGKTPLSTSLDDTNKVDRTRRFSEGGMEMTECIGGLISDSKLHDFKGDDTKPKDHTRLFMSENTAKLDLTECVSRMYPDFTCPEVKQPTGTDKHELQGDRTRVFSDLTAKMDMTECDGGAFQTLAPVSASNASIVSRGEENAIQTDHEHTKVFADDAAGMEMTECVDSVFPAAKKANVSTINENQPDQTKIFSEDTCRMEMTECISSVFPSFSSQPVPSSAKKANVSTVKENLPDQTRIFSEDTCRMEMTECIGSAFPSFSSQPVPSSAKKANVSTVNENPPDQTKIFSEDTCRMEMTECIGSTFPSFSSQPVPSAKKANVSTVTENPPDQTKIFSEDTCRMEMTECIGSTFPSFSSQPVPSSAKKANVSTVTENPPDQTKIFSEDTCRMEMTECIGSTFPSFSSQPVPSSAKKANVSTVNENPPDHTKIFSEDTCRMEMTECIGSTFPSFSSQPVPSAKKANVSTVTENPPDQTKIFSEDTCRMEMTECIGSAFPSFSSQSMSPSAKKANISTVNEKPLDQTKVFSEDTCRMEMTECIGSAFPSFSSQSMPPSAKKANISTVNENPPDQTKIFSEETCRMEMTECIGSAFPSFSSQPVPSSAKKANVSTVTENPPDQTKIFSEDTCRMEMTECVGSAFPSFAASAKKANASIHIENQTDQTKIFGEDTCRMEMTECINATLPSSTRQHDEENDVPISNLSTIVEKSVRENNESMMQTFTGKDYGMELTECVSIADVLRNDTSRFTAATAGDSTKIFSENTAKMDLTECVSGVLSTSLVRRNACDNDDKCLKSSLIVTTKEEINTHAESDATKIFSEHTAKMEITECIGGVLNGSLQGVDTVNRSSSEKEHVVEQTQMFSDNTAKMDMTECVSGMLSTNPDDKDVSAIVTSQQVSKNCEVKDVVTEETDEDKRRSDTFTLNSNKPDSSNGNIGNETKCSSDTFTITKKSCTPSDNNDKQDLKDEESQKSDTVTLDKVPTQTSASEEIPPDKIYGSSKSEESGSTKEDRHGSKSEDSGSTKEDRHGSAESYSCDGIMEEETLQMDNTEDFNMMEGYSELFKKGLKDVTTDCHQLSMDLSVFDSSIQPQASLSSSVPVFQSMLSSHTTDTALPTVSQSNKSSSAAMDDSAFGGYGSAPSSTSSVSSSSFSQSAGDSQLPRLSQADISALTSVSEPHTLPTSGPVQIEEFLDFLSIASSIPKGRRSIMHDPVSVVQPETFSDYLQLNLITQPKHQMYEWANDYLSSSIEKMRETMREQEDRLSKDNPDIVKELQHATPERSAELRKMVVSLHDGCKKSTQKMFKEWRKKITVSTLESLKKYQDDLESRVSVVCNSSEKIEESLKGLDQYDSELDTALSQLESRTSPSAEEQQKYQVEKELLDQIIQEVEQLKETIPALEKQKVDLRKDMETLQAAHHEVELQVQQFAGLSKSPPFDKAEAVNKINRIKRLQEWTLEEYKHDGCKACFTFLEGSISLTFKLGNKIGSEENNVREITSVSYESLLAGDACIAAKVANTMALNAVDIEALRRTTSSTKNIPQVLQQLSTKLCPARLIYDEVESISFWHPLSFSESKLTVEFSHLKAFLKFYVTFELVPGAYPMKAIRPTYRHKIGQNIEQEIEDALSSVKPGWNYLSRLTSTIEELILSKIPKQHDY